MENQIFPKPKVEIKVDSTHINLYPIVGYRDGYHIERRRCRTPEKILGWVKHLSSKNWMDAKSLAKFTTTAFKLVEIEVDYNI